MKGPGYKVIQGPHLHPSMNKEYDIAGTTKHKAMEKQEAVAWGARKLVPSFPGNLARFNTYFSSPKWVKNTSLWWHSEATLAESPQNEKLPSYYPFLSILN